MAIKTDDFAAAPAPRVLSAAPMSPNEEAIERALRTHDGNVSAAAKALGVSRNTLYRRFKSRGH